MYTAKESKDTVHTLKNSTNDLRNELNDTASGVKDDFRDAANNAGRKVRSFFNSASDELSSAKETVTTQIRTNPVQSSFAALGIGFVLGLLYRR